MEPEPTKYLLTIRKGQAKKGEKWLQPELHGGLPYVRIETCRSDEEGSVFCPDKTFIVEPVADDAVAVSRKLIDDLRLPLESADHWDANELMRLAWAVVHAVYPPTPNLIARHMTLRDIRDFIDGTSNGQWLEGISRMVATRQDVLRRALRSQIDAGPQR